MEAVFPSGDSPLLFPELVEEGYEPHKVNYVYISFGRREANMYIDITETVDIKIAALRKHVSQLGDWDPEERVRNWTAESGQKVGYAHAEGFYRIVLQEVEDNKQPEPETEIEAQAEAGD
jgi:LmbE family N-acetylglucosaminyl deacetylase